MKKIILCGYMGSGKTTTAKILAKAAGIPYFDLDEIIEKKAGKSVPELFEQQGEIHFRRLEHEAFKEMLANDYSFVLSLGGGTPCYANNHLLLQQDGVQSIYLKTGIDTIIQRTQVQANKRPLLDKLQGQELKEFIGQHLFERSYYYHHAKHVVTTDGKTPDAVADEIMDFLN
ncbi:shikimate kinase [Flavobacterium sp. RHBU_24]|uniref:shikimate kinase n=1 Tax=Flavobacterium sp. RHBU_24 TaxID=3391185 RepID=UPI003984B513